MSWRESAACGDADPELFFPAAESGPVRDAQVAAARAVCAPCPVQTECLVDAVDAGDDYGIRAGTAPEERRGMRAAGLLDALEAVSTREAQAEATA